MNRFAEEIYNKRLAEIRRHEDLKRQAEQADVDGARAAEQWLKTATLVELREVVGQEDGVDVPGVPNCNDWPRKRYNQAFRGLAREVLRTASDTARSRIEREGLKWV